MKTKATVLLLAAAVLALPALANPGQGSSLPPGLEKKVHEGKPLPPGWQKKLVVGHHLERDIYRHGHIIDRHGDYVTMSIEGRVIRLMANTLEIVEILDSM